MAFAENFFLDLSFLIFKSRWWVIWYLLPFGIKTLPLKIHSCGQRFLRPTYAFADVALGRGSLGSTAYYLLTLVSALVSSPVAVIKYPTNVTLGGKGLTWLLVPCYGLPRWWSHGSRSLRGCSHCVHSEVAESSVPTECQWMQSR